MTTEHHTGALSGATTMTADLDAGATTAADLLDAALRAVRTAPARNALITTTSERAEREAVSSDQRRARGAPLSPLDGVPITYKDLFDVEGTVTTGGSQSRLGTGAARRDSALVARCAALGMVTVGKTNLSEFAFSGLGVNTFFGTPVGPVHGGTPRVAGGSSSGAAVSVGTGVAPIAVGTDTSGSIRIPAAWCGLVGYRASRNRYGPNDFLPLSQTLDCVGVIGSTVGDVRLFDETVRGQPPVPCSPADVPSGLRLVVASGELVDSCSPGIAAAFAAVLTALSEAGISITARRFSSLDDAQTLMDSCGTVVGHEAGPNILGRGLDTRRMQAATLRRLERSARANVGPARLYGQLPELRRRFRAELGDAILVCPTVRIPPPPVSAVLDDSERHDEANLQALRSTMVLSYLGACGLSCPAPAFAGESGLLLSGAHGDDDQLLCAAATVENVLSRPSMAGGWS